MQEYTQSTFIELFQQFPLVIVTASTKVGVLCELLAPVAAAGMFTEEQMQSVVRKALQREGIGSTGIGSGVAVPHARLEFLSTPLLVFGRSRPGIDWESIDAEPVHLWLLVLSPLNLPRIHTRLLESWFRTIRDEHKRLQLLTAKPEELQSIFEDQYS